VSESLARPVPLLRQPALWTTLFGFAICGVLAWQVTHRSRPLPVYSSLPAMQLTDQAGRPFTLERLRGQVSIVNFIFTTCPSVCPLLTGKMAGLQSRILRDHDDLQLVSFSVDTEVDTPAVLTDYATTHHADTKSWTFVTGKPDELVAAVSDGFKVAVQREQKTLPSGAPDGFALVHGENFILVDRQARIRGYYHKDDEDLGRLLADARRLAREGTP
jgi:protein SCO1/2